MFCVQHTGADVTPKHKSQRTDFAARTRNIFLAAGTNNFRRILCLYIVTPTMATHSTIIPCTTFPTFSDWPVHKQVYVRLMSIAQCELTNDERREAHDEIELNNGGRESVAKHPGRFPTFSDWGAYRRLHVNHMSVAQADTDSTYVVVKEGSDLEIDFKSCRLCSERFKLVFDQDEEEWVYPSCKMLHGQPYHFPICWEYAHEC